MVMVYLIFKFKVNSVAKDIPFPSDLFIYLFITLQHHFLVLRKDFGGDTILAHLHNLYD